MEKELTPKEEAKLSALIAKIDIAQKEIKKHEKAVERYKRQIHILLAKTAAPA